MVAIPKGKNFDQHDRTYASFILESEDKDFWTRYAGTVIMVGIRDDYTMEQILEYLFESFHGMSKDEVATTSEDVSEDMKTYFENQ